MAAYPTLSQNTDGSPDFGQAPAISDPTYRSPKESGIVKTGMKVSWVPLQWSFTYTGLSNSNKNTLETFERDTASFGATEFTWTHPISSTTYNVRFARPISFRLEGDQQNSWRVSVVLEQSNSTTS